jgi:hypothetical protein
MVKIYKDNRIAQRIIVWSIIAFGIIITAISTYSARVVIADPEAAEARKRETRESLASFIERANALRTECTDPAIAFPAAGWRTNVEAYLETLGHSYVTRNRNTAGLPTRVSNSPICRYLDIQTMHLEEFIREFSG